MHLAASLFSLICCNPYQNLLRHLDALSSVIPAVDQSEVFTLTSCWVWLRQQSAKLSRYSNWSYLYYFCNWCFPTIFILIITYSTHPRFRNSKVSPCNGLDIGTWVFRSTCHHKRWRVLPRIFTSILILVLEGVQAILSRGDVTPGYQRV